MFYRIINTVEQNFHSYSNFLITITIFAIAVLIVLTSRSRVLGVSVFVVGACVLGWYLVKLPFHIIIRGDYIKSQWGPFVVQIITKNEVLSLDYKVFVPTYYKEHGAPKQFSRKQAFWLNYWSFSLAKADGSVLYIPRHGWGTKRRQLFQAFNVWLKDCSGKGTDSACLALEVAIK